MYYSALHRRSTDISQRRLGYVVVVAAVIKTCRLYVQVRAASGLIRLATIAEPARAKRRRRLLSSALIKSSQLSSASVTVVLIYRSKNATVVSALLNQLPDQADVRLWALDNISPLLVEHTVGQGHGAKFELICRLVEHRPIPEEDYLIVADDDVILVDQTIDRFLSIMQDGRIGVAQPCHDVSSWITHTFVYGRPLRRATLSDFVEIGPLFAISPEWISRVLETFKNAGMGWGIEVRWFALTRQGLRLALADSCRLVHLAEPGTGYDQEVEQLRLSTILEANGVDNLQDLFRRRDRWMVWQRTPPWLGSSRHLP